MRRILTRYLVQNFTGTVPVIGTSTQNLSPSKGMLSCTSTTVPGSSSTTDTRTYLVPGTRTVPGTCTCGIYTWPGTGTSTSKHHRSRSVDYRFEGILYNKYFNFLNNNSFDPCSLSPPASISFFSSAPYLLFSLNATLQN